VRAPVRIFGNVRVYVTRTEFYPRPMWGYLRAACSSEGRLVWFDIWGVYASVTW
jgi:hypothetical protein